MIWLSGIAVLFLNINGAFTSCWHPQHPEYLEHGSFFWKHIWVPRHRPLPWWVLESHLLLQQRSEILQHHKNFVLWHLLTVAMKEIWCCQAFGIMLYILLATVATLRPWKCREGHQPPKRNRPSPDILECIKPKERKKEIKLTKNIYIALKNKVT